MSPRWGRNGPGSQAPPPRSSHPAAGGDWAGDLDWVDPQTGEQQPARRGLAATLSRWSEQRRPGEGDGAPRRPRSRRSRRIIIRRISALFVLAVVVFAAWFLIELYQPFHGGGSGAVTVSIPAGASGSRVGKLLAADDVVSSSFFFDLRASLSGDSNKFRSGVYTLKRGMSYGAALSALIQQAGSSAEVSLTIPEGDTRAQIAVLARKAGLRGNYLKASTAKAAHFSPQAWGAHKGDNSLEGFLFPDTYFVYRHGTVQSLVAKQLAAFEQNFADVNISYAKSKNLTAYDVITIASIIEREAQRTADGPKVAAVIYNRLREGIQLGLDTTLLYYLHDPKNGVLTKHELHLDTPYNTGLNFGLPPTPISNPGLQTLDAAANPARDPNILYFVVKPNACGALAFSTNQAQFDIDAARYNAAVTADHGRLPDGCPATATK
jgi:uncharacterized YceG family protein